MSLCSAGKQMKSQVGWNSKNYSATITIDGKALTAKVGKEARRLYYYYYYYSEFVCH
ncbi:hypothetical protein [Paenibacillus sp. MMO-58]|uniref:hypothetical protein n=1 Tax=Paenibacillus sp. MMO-58 TaxID=3081290 RepID=UPI00301665CA